MFYLFLILYFLWVLAISSYLYFSSLKYYKPIFYYENNEKKNAHDLYKEFQCKDSISFPRIFFGMFFLFPIKISIMIFICLSLNRQLK